LDELTSADEVHGSNPNPDPKRASIGDLLVRIDGDELSLSPVLMEKMNEDA
jgi:hypothetical protein